MQRVSPKISWGFFCCAHFFWRDEIALECSAHKRATIRRIVSVCVFKRAKRGRFAYFALKLALIRLTPASGTGPIWNRQEPALKLKRRPIIKPSLRDGTFSVPKRAKQK